MSDFKKSSEPDFLKSSIATKLLVMNKNLLYITYRVDRILKFLTENCSKDYEDTENGSSDSGN